MKMGRMGVKKRERRLPASFFVWGLVVVQDKVWQGRENFILGKFGVQET